MGIYPVPFPAGYFSAFSSCSHCCVGVAFLYPGSLWFLFIVEVGPGGGIGLMACQGFLVREAFVGVLVGGAGFPVWSAMKCPVVGFEMSVGLV